MTSATSPREGRVGRRLTRILLLLPYAVQHPGVSVGELSRKFGVPARELVRDLNLVFLCGLPGYGPGDLIDVAFEEDRVFVRMADYFGAPLKLTPVEAITLYAGASAIAELPEMTEADALRRALGKLARALGLERGDGAAITRAPDDAPASHLGKLQQALDSGRRVRIEYFSATRGEMSQRDVDPWGLVSTLGRWYLVGHDHLSEDERMFRVDRIKQVAISDQSTEVPADFDPARYKSAFIGRGDQLRVSFEISPAAQRWFEDYYPVEDAADLADGWRRVELVAGSERWAATLSLKLGRDVRNVMPESVSELAGDLARKLAARHS